LKFESGLSERVIARSMSLSNGSVSKRQLSGSPEAAWKDQPGRWAALAVGVVEGLLSIVAAP
jgi:hypothetical protein